MNRSIQQISQIFVFTLTALLGSARADTAGPPGAVPAGAAATASRQAPADPAASKSGALPPALPGVPATPAVAGNEAVDAALVDVALDVPDEPVIDEEVKAESAELEQVRAAEEKAGLIEPMVPEDPAARAAARLGLESPLRLRLRGAFGRETGPAPSSSGGRIAGLPEIDHDLLHLQAEYDIPIDMNPQVIAYVRFFQGPVIRKHFVKWLGRSHRFIPVFRDILREQGLPEDTVYLAMIESGFANLAASRARAVGAWQFIGETGKRMGLRQDFWVDERRDPEKAARAASKYLKELYRQTGDWRLAWAGYNAGVGKIYKARRAGQSDFWDMTRGKVLKNETKGYVPKLMAAAIVAKHHEAFGFTKAEIDAESWLGYEEVEIAHATPLAAIAEAAEVSEKALLDLNPELRRTCTPPRPFLIKLPKGNAAVFARNWPEVSERAGKLAFAQHRVGQGESLKAIASSYHVDVGTIVRMNGLKPGRHVKAGTEIVVPLNALARSQSVAFAATERALAAAEKPARTRRAGHQAVGTHAKLASVAGRLRATVQIRSGDSLWGIAQRFGVAVDEICVWNGIRNPGRFKLQVGHAIVIYPRRNASAEMGRVQRGG